MEDKKKGFNEKKFLLEIKEFKKKTVIHELTKKIEEKQKDIHKEINNVLEQRLEKLRHNALTSNHLSQYIADLNFRLYSIPDKEKLLKGDELKLIQLYTEVISILDKYQNIKSDKFLTDKKELEDRIMEQSLEEQKKELSYLSRQEKYEKYIYDQLLLAQNDLVDICQKYRNMVHLCESYEANSSKLKSELDICKDTNKKLNQIVTKLRKTEKELNSKLMIKENQGNKNLKVFRPIFSSKEDINNKVIKMKENKNLNVQVENFYKININRPKSSIRFNSSNTALILNKNNNNGKSNNKFKLTTTNNIFTKGTIQTNVSHNFTKLLLNNKNHSQRTFARKISFREKSVKSKSISDHTTNYLTKTRNKSMVDIHQPITKNNETIYDRNYLEAIVQFLVENIKTIKEEIKIKVKYKAEEIRTRYQIKYLINKSIEEIVSDIEIMKKEKAFDINNYYENLFGVPENKEMKQIDQMIFDKKKESSGQQLYVLTYILDNCFNGINNVKSIFPKEVLTYINNNE